MKASKLESLKAFIHSFRLLHFDLVLETIHDLTNFVMERELLHLRLPEEGSKEERRNGEW